MNNLCFASINVQVTFRTPRCHFVVQRSNFIFTCSNSNIEYVESYKYLGLWFEEHMNMNKAVRELVKSASRALGALYGKFVSCGGIHSEHQDVTTSSICWSFNSSGTISAMSSAYSRILKKISSILIPHWRSLIRCAKSTTVKYQDSIFVCFVDMRNVFDTVQRNLLWYKLSKL
jgi:hypothetical protein